MNIVYLNGDFLPAEQARISPMDRGFLFGDGIYEVIPSYQGRYVGLEPHFERMQTGLAELKIEVDWTLDSFRKLCDEIVRQNGAGNLGIYLQVTRGVDAKRYHAYSKGMTPTVFIHVFEIPPLPIADKNKAKKFKVDVSTDLRWQRCDIKTTSLLGNVLHFQQGYDEGFDETILFDEEDNLTEASASNVFIVENGVLKTPPLDHHKLAGITRQMLIKILAEHSDIQVQETAITKQQLLQADEVWLTSATKQVAAVTEVAGQQIGNGEIGDMWLKAQKLFSEHQFERF